MKFNVTSSHEMLVRVDVAAGQGVAVLAAAEAPAKDLPALEFSSDGKATLEFRIVTPDGFEVRFNGVRVTGID